MKNHVNIGGRLLNINKTWKDLERSQQEWIVSVIQEHYAQFVSVNGYVPYKQDRQDLVSKVYQKIESRGVWIPFGTAKIHICKHIDRLNRKNKLNGYSTS